MKPDPRLYTYLGTSLVKSGQLEAAIKVFDHAVREGSNLDAYLWQAQNYLLLDQPDQAHVYLQKVDVAGDHVLPGFKEMYHNSR